MGDSPNDVEAEVETEIARQNAPDNARQNDSENDPDDETEIGPEDISDIVPDNASEVAGENAPDNASENLLDNAPEIRPEIPPEIPPDIAPEIPSDIVPDIERKVNSPPLTSRRVSATTLTVMEDTGSPAGVQGAPLAEAAPQVTAPLSPALTSLLYHVELHKTGWWSKAVQQIVLATAASGKGAMSFEDLHKSVCTECGSNIDIERTKNQVDALCAQGSLVRLSDGRIKVSEAVSGRLKDVAEKAMASDTAALSYFKVLAEQNAPGLPADQLWNDFNAGFLLPLVATMGARVYELLAGARVPVKHLPTLADFISKYPQDSQQGLRRLAIEFMDPANTDVRTYVLRRLNAYFFVEACGLSESTVRALSDLPKRHTAFTVFVDTNFLFSVMGLHENPSNEAVRMLMQLTKQVAGSVTVRLYVLPATIAELRKVLSAVSSDLKGLRLTPNVAEAVLKVGDFGGVVEKYISEARKSPAELSPETYFAPYFDNVGSILRAKGLDVYNKNLDRLRTDQAVIDDIMQSLDFEKAHSPRAKTYEQVEHDVVLWHFARSMRKPPIDSPLSATYWVATVDYRLLGFDRRKTKMAGDLVPVCIHPTTLIQMLQLWVPRTQQLEQVMLGSIRLPLLYREFDVESEHATVSILRAVSRFENIGDLPKETLMTIFVDNALRQRMAAETNAGKQIEFVREALVEENRRAASELAAAREEAQRLRDQVAAREARIRTLEDNLRTEREDGDRARTEAAESYRQEKARADEVERRIRELEEAAEASRAAQATHAAVQRFFVHATLLALAGTVLAFVLHLVLRRVVGYHGWRWFAVACGLLLVAVLEATYRAGARGGHLGHKTAFTYLRKVRRYLYLSVGGGVLTHVVFEVLRWLK